MGSIKCLLIFLMVALTIYAPVELTRIIFLWSSDYGDFYGKTAELYFIWVGYLLAIGLTIFCFKEFKDENRPGE